MQNRQFNELIFRFINKHFSDHKNLLKLFLNIQQNQPNLLLLLIHTYK